MSTYLAGPKLKKVFAAIWLALFISSLVVWLRSGIPLAEIPYRLEAWLDRFGLFNAALVYVVFYTFRPLVLFPASLLTVASGLIFGPWLGIVFTIVGENTSANFAFSLARWLGRNAVMTRAGERTLAARWDKRLSRNGLVSVLVMRLVYLPFDLVNFSCGLTSMRQRDFAVGTFIGILPALISFVLFGGVVAADNDHRLLTLGLAALFFLLGIVIARLLKNGKEVEVIDNV